MITKRNKKTVESRGPVWAPTGPSNSLHSQHSKLKITDISQLLWLIQPSKCQYKRAVPSGACRDHLMACTKVPLEAYTGSKKSCHRNQTRDFGAKHTVQYDSVLIQLVKSGVSLILCCVGAGFFQIQSHNTFHRVCFTMHVNFPYQAHWSCWLYK